MEGKEIVLEEMLAFREKRADFQQKLMQDTKAPVISFSMNIPGPIKTNERIRKVFDLGKQELMKQLQEQHIPCGHMIEIHEACGDELLFSVQADPEVIKDITVGIEEQHPLGRLFDMDVIDTDGKKLSRQVYRKCLICDRQAQECARSRAHSVKEMQDAIDALINAHLPAGGQSR
ncbi:MAG: citrate lyase holo-[acyl-carrier protein] synthase [Erysipelotrichaceae bacterium]|nr:citrate lyase holo-[acyl-carrier protein] synthase [Erysipelotrichaceae bacterium]